MPSHFKRKDIFGLVFVFSIFFQSCGGKKISGSNQEGFSLEITIEGSGQVTKSPDKERYVPSDTITVAAIPDSGWSFLGWDGDPKENASPTTFSLRRDLAFSAVFIRKSNKSGPIFSEISLLPTDSAIAVKFKTDEAADIKLIWKLMGGKADSIGWLSRFGKDHDTTVRGLEPESEYRISILARDSIGNISSLKDTLVMTLPDSKGIKSNLVSDDFNSFGLPKNRWTFVNPLGDASYQLIGQGTQKASIEIRVPGGKSHETWVKGFESPQLLQSLNDAKQFSMEAKFLTKPNGSYAIQGLTARNDSAFLRFEVFSEGTQLKLFAAEIRGKTGKTHFNELVKVDSTLFLKVQRKKNTWTFLYGFDGLKWTQAISFTTDISPKQAGIYVGNSGDAAPEVISRIDYFFNSESPIEKEDGVTPTDSIPPVLVSDSLIIGEKNAKYTFALDEASTYGYTLGVTEGLSKDTIWKTEKNRNHSVVLSGLQPSKKYFFKVFFRDSLGNIGNGDVIPFTTSAEGTNGSAITLWYGKEQSFGQVGNPQKWINVLGNFRSIWGRDTLEYSLNGGGWKGLNLGPNKTRLFHPGDFNVELGLALLSEGSNVLSLRGVDSLLDTVMTTATLNMTKGKVWPTTFTMAWDTVKSLNASAQVVDGRWGIENGGLKVLELGYDRLVGIGDTSWTQYEVKVPITIKGVDMSGYAPPSNGPAVGILMRWDGHEADGNQPSLQWWPVGSIGLFRWTKSDEPTQVHKGLYGATGDYIAKGGNEAIEFGATYWFKVRVEAGQSSHRYSLKIWKNGSTEPIEWDLSANDAWDTPRRGSILLLAHHVDAVFGNVEVTGL